MSSEAAGELRAGSRVHVLESATLPDGRERRRLAYEGHDETLGWVSAFVHGEPNLLTEAEALAAHAASLAAAVTGTARSPAPPPLSPQRSKKKMPSFGGGGERCQSCGKIAYQAERMQVRDSRLAVQR